MAEWMATKVNIAYIIVFKNSRISGSISSGQKHNHQDNDTFRRLCASCKAKLTLLVAMLCTQMAITVHYNFVSFAVISLHYHVHHDHHDHHGQFYLRKDQIIFSTDHSRRLTNPTSVSDSLLLSIKFNTNVGFTVIVSAENTVVLLIIIMSHYQHQH